mgnify:CR=1 FL=1
MPNSFERFIARLSPGLALSRSVNRTRWQMMEQRRAQFMGSTYAPVGGGRRSAEFRRNARDAQGAMRGQREPLAFIARDMLRNNPRVVRANNLIAGYTVGAGIRPVVEMKSDEAKSNKDKIEGLILDHLMTNAIDADGVSTLLGHQRLLMGAIPTSGEVLMRRRLRRSTDGLPLPFQVQVLETDYIVSHKHTIGTPTGRRIDEGIEYGPTGRPEFYHLYANHPGSTYGSGDIRKVAAENIAHGFLVDRPGQRRGVSWYAPVMAELHDLHKFMQGTLKRQEVAAMFAGILKTTGDNDPDGSRSDALMELEAGAILELDSGEDLDFNDPPDAQNAEPVVQLIDRVIAGGLMLTYEGLSGDYSRVNYTSGRMARMDQDPFNMFLQEELMIARMMGPLSSWFKEAVFFKTGVEPSDYRLKWTAPRRPVVDPTKDFPAIIKKIRGGLGSRQEAIRELGRDPARVAREIREDNEAADESGGVFDSDARSVSQSGVAQGKANAVAANPEQEDSEND